MEAGAARGSLANHRAPATSQARMALDGRSEWPQPTPPSPEVTALGPATLASAAAGGLCACSRARRASGGAAGGGRDFLSRPEAGIHPHPTPEARPAPPPRTGVPPGRGAQPAVPPRTGAAAAAAARPRPLPSPGGVRPRAVGSGLLIRGCRSASPRAGAACRVSGAAGGGSSSSSGWEAGARGPEPPPGRKRPPQPRLLGRAERLLRPPPPPSPSGNAFLPGRVSRARGAGRRPEARAGTKELLAGAGAALRRRRRRGGAAPGPAWCLSVPVCYGRSFGV